MYVDTYRYKKSVDIIFKHSLDIWGATMKEAPTLLVEFLGDNVWPLGVIWLPLLVIEGSVVITAMIKFVIVDKLSSYNAMLNKLFMVVTKACISLHHKKMKIHTEEIVITITGNQGMARSYYEKAFKEYLQVKNIGNMQEKNRYIKRERQYANS